MEPRAARRVHRLNCGSWTPPSLLLLEDLDAPFVVDFLQHLESCCILQNLCSSTFRFVPLDSGRSGREMAERPTALADRARESSGCICVLEVDLERSNRIGESGGGVDDRIAKVIGARWLRNALRPARGDGVAVCGGVLRKVLDLP